MHFFTFYQLWSYLMAAPPTIAETFWNLAFIKSTFWGIRSFNWWGLLRFPVLSLILSALYQLFCLSCNYSIFSRYIASRTKKRAASMVLIVNQIIYQYVTARFMLFQLASKNRRPLAFSIISYESIHMVWRPSLVITVRVYILEKLTVLYQTIDKHIKH